MRTYTLEIAGESIEMPVSFGAGSALTKAGMDPLQLALQGDIRRHMTSEAVIKVLHIGARAAGSKLTLEQVGAAVFEAGALEYLPAAIGYLSEFVTAAPEHPVGGDSKKAIAPTPKH